MSGEVSCPSTVVTLIVPPPFFFFHSILASGLASCIQLHRGWVRHGGFMWSGVANLNVSEFVIVRVIVTSS
jgi:hypothetical protein